MLKRPFLNIHYAFAKITPKMYLYLTSYLVL